MLLITNYLRSHQKNIGLRIRLKDGHSFSPDELRNMYEIYLQSYQISWDDFLTKRASIDVYAIYTDKNKMVGFTGLRYRKITVDGVSYVALYIGQTIITHEYRGKSLIQKTVIKMFFKHYLSNPFSKLIVWTNAITYRPYLVMSKGLKDYYPHVEGRQSVHFKNIQNKLGTIYYGEDYIPEKGLVKKAVSTLAVHEKTYSEKELSDAHIKYFLSLNSDISGNYGLISFCMGSMDNLVYYLKKRIKRKYATKR